MAAIAGHARGCRHISPMTGAQEAEYLVRLPAARGDLVAGHLGRTPARSDGTVGGP